METLPTRILSAHGNLKKVAVNELEVQEKTIISEKIAGIRSVPGNVKSRNTWIEVREGKVKRNRNSDGSE